MKRQAESNCELELEAQPDKKDAKLYGIVILPPIISDNVEHSTPVIEVISHLSYTC